MEKWFFINISSINISDGYPDFYFGAIDDSAHYFKKKFPTHQEFEEILHDKIGAILLKNRVPDYNLVIIVSKPFANIFNNIKDKERGITPFLNYVNERIEALSDFLSKKPNNKFVFELDERVGEDNMGAHGSKFETIHWLDHQPSNTLDYKIGQSWPDTLKDFLKNNTSGNSNLQFFARVKGIYFCRISLYRKKYEDYLHYLFSFLQLFITDGIQKKVLTKNSLNELDFEGNDISAYFSTFCRQVNESLDTFKRKIGEEITEAKLRVVKKRAANIDRTLKEMEGILSTYRCSTEDLNCSNVRGKLDHWIDEFEQFSKNLPRTFYDFNNFLNDKSNLIDTNQKSESGNLEFWTRMKIELSEEHKSLSGRISATAFDETGFVDKWKEALSQKFIEIKKDVQRCPNQGFMLIILTVSLIFYCFACYSVISKMGIPEDYIISFVIVTLIYLTASLYLYFKYRKESINRIKRKIKQLEAFNKAQVSSCIQQLTQKASNQTNIYQLGIVNQNIATTEKSLMFFAEQDYKIESIRRKNVNISSIANINAVKMDFELHKEVPDTPASIYKYIKVFDSKLDEEPIKLYKNLNDQNQDIKKFNNRNNALKAIKISQK